MTATKISFADRRTARTGILGALVAVLMVLGVGLAGAADKTLTWKGKFPVIGEQQVTTVVHAEIPGTAKAGETVTVPFSLDVDAGVQAAEGLKLVGATKLSGHITSSVNITAADGTSIPVAVELPIPDTKVPEQGPLKFTAKGTVKIEIPAQFPKGAAKSAVAKEASTHVVTDSQELGEFDVALQLAPANQDTVLGSTKIS